MRDLLRKQRAARVCIALSSHGAPEVRTRTASLFVLTHPPLPFALQPEFSLSVAPRPNCHRDSLPPQHRMPCYHLLALQTLRPRSFALLLHRRICLTLLQQRYCVLSHSTIAYSTFYLRVVTIKRSRKETSHCALVVCLVSQRKTATITAATSTKSCLATPLFKTASSPCQTRPFFVQFSLQPSFSSASPLLFVFVSLPTTTKLPPTSHTQKNVPAS